MRGTSTYSSFCLHGKIAACLSYIILICCHFLVRCFKQRMLAGAKSAWGPTFYKNESRRVTATAVQTVKPSRCRPQRSVASCRRLSCGDANSSRSQGSPVTLHVRTPQSDTTTTEMSIGLAADQPVQEHGQCLSKIRIFCLRDLSGSCHQSVFQRTFGRPRAVS